jgi:hypothetical protein
MTRLPLMPRAARPAEAFDAHVARAGLALGCSYSSSAEYEAALIAERRAAGAYRAHRPRRHLWLVAPFGVALVLGLLAL